MQLHVEGPGQRSTMTPGRKRGPMTPVRLFKAQTFEAPVSRPWTRTVARTWRAVSLGADGEPDGLWEYHRREGVHRSIRWLVIFLPTGQTACFSSRDGAREATAGELFTRLRGEAFTAAFDKPTADGHRWLAVYMRLNGAAEVDAQCFCGGLLVVALKDGRYAHVDACAQCRSLLPATGPVVCAAASGHRFCARPDPLLTEVECRMLEFESRWWSQPGARATAIRDEFAMTEIRFLATLNGLLDKQDAERRYPTVVHRLRGLRGSRSRTGT